MRAPSSRTRRKVGNRAELTGGLAASLERSPGCWRESTAQPTRSRGRNAGESEGTAMDTPKATGRAQHDRLAPQIEMRSPASLKPNPRNARTRTKREIRRIADSIQSAGNLQPIVVDENDVILAGHGRLAAGEAARLGDGADDQGGRAQRGPQAPVRDCRQQADQNAGW